MTLGKVVPGGTSALASAKTAHQGGSTGAPPVLPERISPVYRHEPRFLMKVTVGYPPREDEQRILRLARQEARDGTERIAQVSSNECIPAQAVLEARQEILNQHLAEPLEGYIVELVQATRAPGRYDSELGGWLNWGASPRATLALDRCARVQAWLQGRDFVTPEDIQDIAPDVLRHRLLLSYEAESSGITVETVIQRLLSLVAVP
ncbi:MAG: MoxR family ATPase [Arenicellales bacterium]|nr:MoxR family ATPase [Arenicellales bacterium]